MENRYFYCYSKPLKEFIVSKGKLYITRSIHEKTKRTFWVFEGDCELNKLLDTWKSNKNK